MAEPPPAFTAMNDLLEGATSEIFPETGAPVEKDALKGLAASLTRTLRSALDEYASVPADRKMEFKPALKHAQAVLDALSRALRFDEDALAPDDPRLAPLRYLLEERDVLVRTQFRFLAERELRVFGDEKFRGRLADLLERFWA
ncbi:MAG: hypothetical protein Kow0069_32870 [Promethearchaeota archaeon]